MAEGLTTQRGETAAHSRLKRLALVWAQAHGYSACAVEVSLPYCRYRADVAAYREDREGDHAAVFECKQALTDLRRDNCDSIQACRCLELLETRGDVIERNLRVHYPTLRTGETLFPDLIHGISAGSLIAATRVSGATRQLFTNALLTARNLKNSRATIARTCFTSSLRSCCKASPSRCRGVGVWWWKQTRHSISCKSHAGTRLPRNRSGFFCVASQQRPRARSTANSQLRERKSSLRARRFSHPERSRRIPWRNAEIKHRNPSTPLPSIMVRPIPIDSFRSFP